ncbi:MAG TPA: PrgI family protein [Candidatus Saccharimonadales bacterium]|nr:PrgI family protein [Candidatus Saccharimonadales bacterium]
MAVYKVIQDVEAEDKLLGPLTLKGFIYAGIAGFCAFIIFRLLFIGTPLKWLFILMFLGPMILFGVLASPLGRDQPTEVWLLSKIRFFLKPRRRIWDQEGLEQHVTITAPKKVEQSLTKNLSQNEVQSRLKTLASTLDTRGWAVKNVDTSLNTVAPDNPVLSSSSDRLVANAGYTQAAPVVDIHPSDDILDENSNPTAQKFATMMNRAEGDRKRNLQKTVKTLAAKSDETEEDELKLPANTEFEQRLAKARASFSKVHGGKGKKHASTHHKSTASKKTAEKERPAAKAAAPPVTSPRQAVNMELAQSGSAFSVATLSQLANRQPRAEKTGPDEITISLH